TRSCLRWESERENGGTAPNRSSPTCRRSNLLAGVRGTATALASGGSPHPDPLPARWLSDTFSNGHEEKDSQSPPLRARVRVREDRRAPLPCPLNLSLSRRERGLVARTASPVGKSVGSSARRERQPVLRSQLCNF